MPEKITWGWEDDEWRRRRREKVGLRWVDERLDFEIHGEEGCRFEDCRKTSSSITEPSDIAVVTFSGFLLTFSF